MSCPSLYRQPPNPYLTDTSVQLRPTYGSATPSFSKEGGKQTTRYHRYQIQQNRISGSTIIGRAFPSTHSFLPHDDRNKEKEKRDGEAMSSLSSSSSPLPMYQLRSYPMSPQCPYYNYRLPSFQDPSYNDNSSPPSRVHSETVVLDPSCYWYYPWDYSCCDNE